MPMMDGIETTRRLKALDPNIGIVALTGLEDQRAVRDMLVAGASGYVLKDSDGDEILNAVREAATGGGVISPQLTPAIVEELTEALERERRRTRQLEIAQEALLERARTPSRAGLAPGPRAAHAGDRDPGHGPDARDRHCARGNARGAPGPARRAGAGSGPARAAVRERPSRPASPSGPTSSRSRGKSPRPTIASASRRPARPPMAEHQPPGRQQDPGGAGRERARVLARRPPRDGSSDDRGRLAGDPRDRRWCRDRRRIVAARSSTRSSRARR